MEKTLVRAKIKFTYDSEFSTLEFTKKRELGSVINVGDEFYCTKEQLEYLKKNKAVEEVLPTIEEEPKEEKKEAPKKSSKKVK